MFNLNESRAASQMALDNARKVVDQSLMDGLTRAFVGQGSVSRMNTAMDQGQAVLDGVKQMNWIAQYGQEASARVVSVVDTGITIHMNPVVELSLKVTPSAGREFGTVSRAMVPRIAIPRKGDRIRIKYNPADPTQICVMP